MKKSLLLAGMLAVGLANAQTGKVGINTENPNETLEINGTLRVDNLPESSVGKIYDGADTTETTFTGTRVLVADEKGNIGISSSAYNFPLVIRDSSEGDIPTVTIGIPSINYDDYESIYDIPNGGRNENKELFRQTFTLDKKSLVVFRTNIGVTYDGGSVRTPMRKRVAVLLKLNGRTIQNNGLNALLGEYDEKYYNYIEQEEAKAREAGILGENEEFTTQVKSAMISGPYSVTGNIAMVLEPDVEYTFTLEGRAQVQKLDYGALRASFANATADTVSIIAYPLEF